MRNIVRPVRGGSLSEVTEVRGTSIEREMKDSGGFDLGCIRDDKAKVVGMRRLRLGLVCAVFHVETPLPGSFRNGRTKYSKLDT